MTTTPPLEAEKLCLYCDPARLDFETTAELQELDRLVGQDRASEAIRFGIDVAGPGYNIYALGPAGIGKHTLVRDLLEEKAATQTGLSDWCYVNNFDQSARPKLLQLPAGRGVRLRDDMQQLVEELHSAITAAFRSEEYRAARKKIEEQFEQSQEQAFRQLQEESARYNIKLIQRPGQFTFAPQHEGHAMATEEFKKLPENERKRIEDNINELEQHLETILEKHIPQWRHESGVRVKQLNRTTAMTAVDHIIEALKTGYRDIVAVLAYLDHVKDDVIEHVDAFRKQTDDSEESPFLPVRENLPLRYKVNLLVDNSERTSAPVIYEDNPNFNALIGRIEHTAQLGTLVTDFTQIKPGALHKANGGFLMLDARKLLTQPYAWDGLKRVLQSREIRIESLAQLLSLVSTTSLEPEPVPIDTKIVLLGDRWLYYLLQALDPDFAELFKVAADFDSSLPRSGDSDMLYARLIATLSRKHQLPDFDRSGVAAMIQFSMRQVEDIRKLSTHMRSLTDLMQEASYYAGRSGHSVVTGSDVQQARDAQTTRLSRSRDLLQEAVQRGTLMIASSGSEVGQINGITVIDLGNFSFGLPARITATTRLGEGEMIDIERETELGGPIHTKGVFILSSFVGSHYSPNVPLSLAASLTIEQSYADVEGDSASLAELCALLSSLANTPLKQSLAVTGSVNQLGRVQAVGGVNDKIEGFFDICRQRGLNGEQGVIIPASNVEHLMLREEVVAAAKAGQFSVYPVSDVDQALELLTGMSAGQADNQGMFEENTFNNRVQTRLIELATIRHAFAEAAKGHVQVNDEKT